MMHSRRSSLAMAGAQVEMLFSSRGAARAYPQWRRRACALVLMASDVFASVLALLTVMAAMRLVSGQDAQLASRNLQASLVEFALIVLGLIAWLTLRGRYHRRQPFWWTLRQVALATGVGVLCNGFVEYAFKTDTSRVLVIGTWLLLPVTLTLMYHLTILLLQRVGLWSMRTVVVGEGEGVQRVLAALTSERDLGYEVAGVIGRDVMAGMPRRSRGGQVLEQFGAHFLVLAPDAGERRGECELEEDLLRERAPFAVMPPTLGLPLLASEQTYFIEQDLMMLSFWKGNSKTAARLIKVVFDVTAAAAMLAILSPLMLLIALAVKLDGGPVFYAHKRLGVGRSRFGCLKFRSMRTDSGAMLAQVLRDDPAKAAEWAMTQKLRDDPRITRVGALLRATSLDELPQLINVLRLEMSLVGPRPIVDEEVVHYGKDIAHYYRARPGLTGLWQVSGRSDVGYRQRVQLDMRYIKNWTLWHDFVILCRTVPAVLKRTGAV